MITKDHTTDQQQTEQPTGESLIPYREQRVRYDGAVVITRLKKSTLRKYVSLGKIPHEKVGRPGSHGGAVLFKVGALLDWLESFSVVPGEETEIKQ